MTTTSSSSVSTAHQPLAVACRSPGTCQAKLHIPYPPLVIDHYTMSDVNEKTGKAVCSKSAAFTQYDLGSRNGPLKDTDWTTLSLYMSRLTMNYGFRMEMAGNWVHGTTEGMQLILTPPPAPATDTSIMTRTPASESEADDFPDEISIWIPVHVTPTANIVRSVPARSVPAIARSAPAIVAESIQKQIDALVANLAPDQVEAMTKKAAIDDRPSRTRELSLSGEWFALVCSGLKRFEGRRFAKDVKEFRAGDTIMFRYRQPNGHTDPTLRFSKMITAIHRFATFRAGLEHFHERNMLDQVLPGVETVEQGCEIYLQFVSLPTQIADGVCFIELDAVIVAAAGKSSS